MLCEKCKKNHATFHYRSNENGHITETHLCSICAKASGFADDSSKIFNPFDFNSPVESIFNDFLGGMFPSDENRYLKESAVCPFCGTRLHDFSKSGKAGCAKCYSTFKNALAATIKKLHGNTKHTGKVPAGRAESKLKADKKAELETLLKKAIDEQEYEKAAEYRDKIRELDNEQK